MDRATGNVLNRGSQLPELADSVGGTSGIWAPTLRRMDDMWYLVTTMVHDKKAADDSTRWRNVGVLRIFRLRKWYVKMFD